MSKITTIIPTFQRPQLLKRAISSVLNQTFPHLRLHIYDNASGDSTEKVVREYMEKDDRVSYFCHEENVGMLNNYQCGLSEIKTDYFSFLSDDDILFPWFYEEALKGFKESPECLFSAGSAIIMSEKGRVVHVPLDGWEKEGMFSPPDGMLEMITKYPVPSCILFHKNVLETAFIDMQNPLTWDCDFLLQIAMKYPYYIFKKPCGIFLHHTSYSNSKGLKEWREAWQRVQDRIKSNAALDPQLKQKASDLIDRDLKITHRHFMMQSLLSKKTQEAYDQSLVYRKNYGWNRDSVLLLCLAKLCSWIPFLVYFLPMIRTIKRIKKNRINHRYKKFAMWLQ